MDKEQARFILQSFRPDGADAQDPDFATALAVAAEDRELGDWLAAERAQDAAFAAALNGVEIPEHLRENILSVLRGEHPGEEDFGALDATFIGALAALRPPEGLRDQIVTAMRVETTTGAESTAAAAGAPKRVFHWMRSAAVAAALVLGAFVGFELTSKPDDGGQGASPPLLSLATVEHRSIDRVANGLGEIRTGNDFAALNTYLESRGLPTLRSDELPPGLSGVNAVGCKLLKLGERNASLLCFDQEGQQVHLVVVRREDLEPTELATLKNMKAKSDSCWQCPNTKVSVATWGDDEKAFVLLSKTDPDQLRERFF